MPKKCNMSRLQHEETEKRCNMKGVQQTKKGATWQKCNMKRVQHEKSLKQKKSYTESVQHEKSATWNECTKGTTRKQRNTKNDATWKARNMKKVQHEKITTQK